MKRTVINWRGRPFWTVMSIHGYGHFTLCQSLIKFKILYLTSLVHFLISQLHGDFQKINFIIFKSALFKLYDKLLLPFWVVWFRTVFRLILFFGRSSFDFELWTHNKLWNRLIKLKGHLHSVTVDYCANYVNNNVRL